MSTFHLEHKVSIYWRGRTYAVNSEAKRGSWVNPCLLSSNKCRPHLSTYITAGKAGRGGASLCTIVNYEKAVKHEVSRRV